MVTLGAAKLMGIILETLGYGIFLVMFVYNLYLQANKLPKKGEKTPPNMVLLIASVVLFMLITTRWAIEVARLYEAVITLECQVPISEYFADMTRRKQVAVTAVFEAQIMLADFVLVYRLYHVWKPHWWICIFPALAWVGVTISSICSLWSMASAGIWAGVFQPRIKVWLTASFFFTISNNLFCTVAIILRLWKSHRSVAGATVNSYVLRALRVFAESAALLTLGVIATFGTFLAGSNVQYTLLDAASPVIGISFVLILLRLNHTGPQSTGPSTSAPSPSGTLNKPPNRPINVKVTEHVDIDSDTKSKGSGKGSCDDMV